MSALHVKAGATVRVLIVDVSKIPRVAPSTPVTGASARRSNDALRLQ